MKSKNLKYILIILLNIILLVIILFVIDNYRMKKNLPVLFSTWGKLYVPKVNKRDNSFELIISSSNKNELIKITNDELEGKYDYDIFYYGIETVSIEYKNSTINLKQALINDTITMDQIIQRANSDVSEGKSIEEIYKDGGTQRYSYDTYSIIKANSLDGNRNIYIGLPNMTLEDIM